MNKTVLREVILTRLKEELALQLKAAELARDEAISDESRARSKYDTHSQEAAYLAQGQAKIAAEIETNLEAYASLPFPDFQDGDVIALGALVQLDNSGHRTWYLLGPRAGGLEITCEGRDILLVTPQSPLGRELIGRRIGDSIQSPGRGGTRLAQTIVALE